MQRARWSARSPASPPTAPIRSGEPGSGCEESLEEASESIIARRTTRFPPYCSTGRSPRTRPPLRQLRLLILLLAATGLSRPAALAACPYWALEGRAMETVRLPAFASSLSLALKSGRACQLGGALKAVRCARVCDRRAPGEHYWVSSASSSTRVEHASLGAVRHRCVPSCHSVRSGKSFSRRILSAVTERRGSSGEISDESGVSGVTGSTAVRGACGPPPRQIILCTSSSDRVSLSASRRGCSA